MDMPKLLKGYRKAMKKIFLYNIVSDSGYYKGNFKFR